MADDNSNKPTPLPLPLPFMPPESRAPLPLPLPLPIPNRYFGVTYDLTNHPDGLRNVPSAYEPATKGMSREAYVSEIAHSPNLTKFIDAKDALPVIDAVKELTKDPFFNGVEAVHNNKVQGLYYSTAENKYDLASKEIGNFREYVGGKLAEKGISGDAETTYAMNLLSISKNGIEQRDNLEARENGAPLPKPPTMRDFEAIKEIKAKSGEGPAQ